MQLRQPKNVVKVTQVFLQCICYKGEWCKSHIDLIDLTHPLLCIATDCLSYSEEGRPSTSDLCHCLAALKPSGRRN